MTKPLLVNFKPLDSLSSHLHEAVQFMPLVKETIASSGFEVIEANSWAELKCISKDTKIIEFHATLPRLLHISIDSFIEKIKKSIAHTNAKLVVVTKKTQPRYIIKRFQQLGLNGVTLHSLSWTMADRVESLKANLEGEYWPDNIFNELADVSQQGKPLVLIFRENWEYEIPPETFFTLNADSNSFRIKFCGSWKEVSDILHLDPALIVFHENTIRLDHKIVEFTSTLESLIFYTCDGKKIPLALTVNKKTPYALIKEAKRTSVAGLVPNSVEFGIGELISSINLILSGISYWPAHIIDSLPGAIQKIKPPLDEIKLTGRQSEIFNLVCRRGLSNKKIAQILNISESTVKVHMSAILKAYRVRNRTQLALSGSQVLSK